MAMVNLRAPYAPFLVATDASLTGLAAVRAPLSSLFSQELCRHSLRKSCWSTLLPPGKSWKKQHGLLEPEDELDDAEESFQVHPLWELCARGCSFSTTWSSRADSNLHINLLEMKAHLREERRLARSGRSLRVPQGLDSQVCLGALVKGRASSTALTREMRKGLGYGIGSNLYNFYMFFPLPSTELMALQEAKTLLCLMWFCLCGGTKLRTGLLSGWTNGWKLLRSSLRCGTCPMSC